VGVVIVVFNNEITIEAFWVHNHQEAQCQGQNKGKQAPMGLLCCFFNNSKKAKETKGFDQKHPQNNNE